MFLLITHSSYHTSNGIESKDEVDPTALIDNKSRTPSVSRKTRHPTRGADRRLSIRSRSPLPDARAALALHRRRRRCRSPHRAAAPHLSTAPVSSAALPTIRPRRSQIVAAVPTPRRRPSPLHRAGLLRQIAAATSSSTSASTAADSSRSGATKSSSIPPPVVLPRRHIRRLAL